MIIVKDIDKSYGDKIVLSKINLNLELSKIVLLQGENGSGKTTLLKIMLGLLKSFDGFIEYNGHSFAGSIEEPAFDASLTGEQNLNLLCNVDNKYLNELLLGFNMVNEYKKKVSTYSLGMKQKLALCLLLMKQTDYLFLDEPINSLDSKSIVFLKKQIINRKSQDFTTVLVSHQVKWMIDICDEVYTLKDGYVSLDNAIIKSDKYIFTFANSNEALKAKKLLDTCSIEDNCIIVEIENGLISQTIRLLAKYDLIQVNKKEEDII